MKNTLIALDWIEKELSMRVRSWMVSENAGYIFTNKDQHVIDKLNNIGIDIAPSEIIRGEKEIYIYVRINDVLNQMKVKNREDKLKQLGI